MTKVDITDPNLATTLNTADVPLEIRTPEGALLGYFTPMLNSRYEPIESDISPEELRRRVEDRTAKTYTTAEVLAHIRGQK